MEFVFWQNVLSIHQSSFLRNLSLSYKVVLVVEKKMSDRRLKEGWDVPDMGDTQIIIAPSLIEVTEIVNSHREAIHVFSGIHAYPLVNKAFHLIHDLRLKTLVLAEPYDFLGFKGFLRRYRKKIQFLKYGRGIHGLLHTGELGKYWFEKAGFPKEKLFHWGYFTEEPVLFNDGNLKYGVKNKASILFVGTINKNKNILGLVSIVKKYLDLFDNFTIIGVGPLENELKNAIQDNKNIKYIGKLPNSQVQVLMQDFDMLILPSFYDGWGAVVNEALQNGMRVICSEHCGASSLLDNKNRGEVFYFRKGDNLDTVLKKWLIKGPLTFEKREEIIEWSKHSISGIVITEYFIQICKYIFENEGVRPVAPWLT